MCGNHSEMAIPPIQRSAFELHTVTPNESPRRKTRCKFRWPAQNGPRGGITRCFYARGDWPICASAPGGLPCAAFRMVYARPTRRSTLRAPLNGSEMRSAPARGASQRQKREAAAVYNSAPWPHGNTRRTLCNWPPLIAQIGGFRFSIFACAYLLSGGRKYPVNRNFRAVGERARGRGGKRPVRAPVSGLC